MLRRTLAHLAVLRTLTTKSLRLSLETTYHTHVANLNITNALRFLASDLHYHQTYCYCKTTTNRTPKMNFFIRAYINECTGTMVLGVYSDRFQVNMCPCMSNFTVPLLRRLALRTNRNLYMLGFEPAPQHVLNFSRQLRYPLIYHRDIYILGTGQLTH